MRNAIPQTVENVLYPKLKAVAVAYVLGERRIYKRYQRGKRGDDLIPVKYRKDYIPPTPKPKKVSRISREFTAGGIKYQNAADACRKLGGVSYNTYKSRISRKWTKEEALEIVPRIDKRTIKHSSKERSRSNSRKPLIAFGREYKNYSELEKQFGIKSYVLWQRVNILGKTLEEAILMDGKGKKIRIEGIEYNSNAAFARAIGIDPHNFYQLRRKYTVEQIAGIEDRVTATSVVHKGKYYPSQTALAESYGLTANEYYYRIHTCRLSMDEALSFPHNSSVVESVFGNEGKLYIAEITDHAENEGKELYKIGVTQHNLNKRYEEFPFNCVTVLCKKGNISRLKEVEKKIKDIYKDNIYDGFSGNHFDGFTEVYQLTKSEINKLKLLIRFDIVGLTQTKGSLDMTVEA
jgi:hypothetical protein